ncbi:hypothetical protein [Gaetbulibacter sp. PBL-D1]|uniref:hypothetical protein n=1 Tax=Gaetbulibacter sp. PBL-D1 TaxID=3422594 RepID=UPI003D2F3F0E
MMKTKFYILSIALFCLLSCKSEKKENTKKEINQSTEETPPPSAFESSLLDLRPIEKDLTSGYKVNKFGIQKENDSLIGFVFLLDNNATPETVEAFSMGIRAFDRTLEKPLNMSFNPEIEIIEGQKYVIAKQILKSTNYFDSVDVFIYKRKDWKGSGRLGGFKIRDILFE